MTVILYVVAVLSVATGDVSIRRTIWEGSISECNKYAVLHKNRLSRSTDARIWCKQVFLKDPSSVPTFKLTNKE